LHANRLATVSDRLAYHYSHTLHHAKAVDYLGRLALRASHEGAHDEAIKTLDQALDHLGRSTEPPGEATRRELVLRKARSLFFLGRFSEVLALLLPEQAGVDAAADPRLAAAYYLRLGSTQTYLGGHRDAVDNANRALQAATACNDRATMGKAHFLLALESFWAQPIQGVQHGEQAVALLQDTPDRWWLGQACWILGLNLSYRGRFAEALAMEARAQALAQQSEDRRLASYAAWTTGFIHTLAGELDLAVPACRHSVALALDPLNRMTAQGMLALALVERRDTAEAIRVLDEAIPQAVQFRIPHMHGLFLAFRGEAALQAGQLPEAQELARQGADITREANYVYGLGWAQRVLGRVALAAGDAALARTGLAEAALTFDTMGAPYEAARTRLELAGLLQRLHLPAEAAPLAEAGMAVLASLGLVAQAERYRVIDAG
jgi:tetratricopeptide (TPR) repeat protein